MTGPADEAVAVLRGNADLAIARLGPLADIDFGLNEESVEWVDGFVERRRADGGEAGSGLLAVLGSFLGECVIARHGGGWADVDGAWGVRFGSGQVVFPFEKVARQFERGHDGGESILSLYQLVPRLLRLPD